MGLESQPAHGSDTPSRVAHAGVSYERTQMYKILVCIMLLVISQLALADECILDQATRVNDNIELQKKYPRSYLIEKNLILVVPVEDGEVHINIGGCTHYGVTIELWTTNAEKYISEEAFMNLILHLARVYSQKKVNQTTLQKLILEKRWMQSKSPRRMYFFDYDETDIFEVYERNEGRYIVIGFSTYS